MCGFSVAWQARINSLGPRVNAASQVRHMLEPVLLQERGNCRAADPVVAVHHDVRAAVEFVQAREHLAHGDMERAGEADDRHLLRLAHVQQHEPLALLDERLYLLRSELVHLRGVLSPRLACAQWGRSFGTRRIPHRAPCGDQ